MGGRNNRGRGNANNPPAPVYDTSQVQCSVMVESQSTPILADGAIWTDAAHPLVAHTACLGWKTIPSVLGQTASDAQLTSAQAVSSFLSRCFVEDTPQSKAAAARAHILNFRLSATAWSRILSVYLDSGILTQSCADLPSFRKVVSSIVFTRPQDLALLHTDWNLGEDFVIPTGNANAEVEEREILSPLRFFSLASVVRLEVEAHPTSRLNVLTSLVGAAGPCLTQASRIDETASLHFVSHHIRKTVGTAMRDGAIVFSLPNTIGAAVLPDILQPLVATSVDLMNELIDALAYTTSTSQREVIEEKRVFLLGRR